MNKLTERLHSKAQLMAVHVLRGDRHGVVVLLREAASALEQAKKDVAALALDNAELLSQGLARGRALEQAERALREIAGHDDAGFCPRCQRLTREAFAVLAGKDKRDNDG